jgi:hypothetical protein
LTDERTFLPGPSPDADLSIKRSFDGRHRWSRSNRRKGRMSVPVKTAAADRGVAFDYVRVLARPRRRAGDASMTRTAIRLKGLETAPTKRMVASAVTTALLGIHHVN